MEGCSQNLLSKQKKTEYFMRIEQNPVEKMLTLNHNSDNISSSKDANYKTRKLAFFLFNAVLRIKA